MRFKAKKNTVVSKPFMKEPTYLDFEEGEILDIRIDAWEKLDEETEKLEKKGNYDRSN